jgi:Phage tail assembly chaperone protein, TAC
MILAISALMKLKSGENSKKDFLEIDLKELDTDILGKAARALIERMDEDEVVGLIKKLTSEGVLCDHQPIVFDTHYEGNLGHLFKVLMAALEVQYGNFTGAILARVPVAVRPVHSQAIKSV